MSAQLEKIKMEVHAHLMRQINATYPSGVRGARKRLGLHIGVTPSRVAALCQGRVEDFSLDWLLTHAIKLGAKVTICMEDKVAGLSTLEMKA